MTSIKISNLLNFDKLQFEILKLFRYQFKYVKCLEKWKYFSYNVKK